MEFFDLHYCRALIEYNISDDAYYKIEQIKKINNQHRRRLLRIEIELEYDIKKNKKKYKKYKFNIIKNIIDLYFVKKEIKCNNILQNKNIISFFTSISTSTITDINSSCDDITLKIKEMFKIKINSKNKIIFNYFIHNLQKELSLFSNPLYKNNDNLDYIKILVYQFSQIDIKYNLMLEIKSFIKNKNKIDKSMANITRIINLIKKTENKSDAGNKKSYLKSLIFLKLISNNQILIEEYKKNIDLIINGRTISNAMNRNHNKCEKFDKNDDIICSICLDQVEEGISTNCKHVFHLECINLYVHNILGNHFIDIICPMCRAYI